MCYFYGDFSKDIITMQIPTTNSLIGRETEKARLDTMLTSGQADFLAVYGRRRVGKTFLIRQHLKNNIVFDFTGTREEQQKSSLKIFLMNTRKEQKAKKKNRYL
jgi:uncharacterized protein